MREDIKQSNDMLENLNRCFILNVISIETNQTEQLINFETNKEIDGMMTHFISNYS